jgi:hypothetical protein
LDRLFLRFLYFRLFFFSSTGSWFENQDVNSTQCTGKSDWVSFYPTCWFGRIVTTFCGTSWVGRLSDLYSGIFSYDLKLGGRVIVFMRSVICFLNTRILYSA